MSILQYILKFLFSLIDSTNAQHTLCTQWAICQTWWSYRKRPISCNAVAWEEDSLVGQGWKMRQLHDRDSPTVSATSLYHLCVLSMSTTSIFECQFLNFNDITLQPLSATSVFQCLWMFINVYETYKVFNCMTLQLCLLVSVNVIWTLCLHSLTLGDCPPVSTIHAGLTIDVNEI